MDGMIYHDIQCPTLTKTGACTCKQLIEVEDAAPRGPSVVGPLDLRARLHTIVDEIQTWIDDPMVDETCRDVYLSLVGKLKSALLGASGGAQ